MPALTKNRFGAYAPVVALLVVTFGLLGVSPNSLRVAFPALAAVAAALVFRQSRVLYVQMCLWLWFLSPLLRRLVDYRTEFVATSPLLLAPFFACGLSGVVLLRRPRVLATHGAVPITCALGGIFFGTVYGLTRYAPADVARGLVNWLAPVLFAAFLFTERARFAEYRGAVQRTLLWATLLLGLYGVAQFFLLPAWDEAWMRGLQDGAFGQPLPLEVRVFSTMNAPATLATYLMAGLLFAFAALIDPDRSQGSTRRLALFAAPVGLLALALTTSRSLWLGLVFGVLYLSSALPARLRVRVIAAVLVTLVLAAASTLLPAINQVVVSRLKTFSSGASDVSASARIDGHAQALGRLATEPLGEGMGSTDADHATDGSDDRLGPHDSTLLEFLYALGGPGTLVYAVGLGLGFVQIFLPRQKGDPAAIALRSILFALFLQCLLTSILVGVPGFLTWTCLALGLSQESQRPIGFHSGMRREPVVRASV